MTDPEEPAPTRPKRILLREDGPAEGAEAVSPQDAPPPPDAAIAPVLDAASPNRRGLGFWARLLLWAGGLFFSLSIAVSVDRLVRELSAASPWLAWTAAILAGLAVLALLVLILRELAAVARLRRVEALRRAEAAARVGGSVPQAREVCARLRALYAGRRDVAVDWRRLAEQADDAMDAGARIALYERRVLEPLDAEARAAVRQAARRVSIVTALAPSLLLDAAAALYLNAAMIRRLAEIYGGRAGLAGTIRLARRVVAHAMAMGLIALTDDMLEPLLGGGVAAKVSRRLGEGVVNGAMTARLGLAAMEVCRPLAFEALPKPSLREVMWDALRKR